MIFGRWNSLLPFLRVSISIAIVLSIIASQVGCTRHSSNASRRIVGLTSAQIALILNVASVGSAQRLVTAFAKGENITPYVVDGNSVVPVYRISDEFMLQGGGTSDLGELYYVAVPIRIDGRSSVDTLKLTVDGGGREFIPVAVASGGYEWSMSRRLTGEGKLLQNAEDWLQWDDRGLLMIQSWKHPELDGKRLDPASFRY